GTAADRLTDQLPWSSRSDFLLEGLASSGWRGGTPRTRTRIDSLTLSSRSRYGGVSAMAYSLVTFERRGAVALVTLNRPEKLNAWTPAFRLQGCGSCGSTVAAPRSRQSAVRNIVRARVTELVAMRVSGHRTQAVFDRYDITSKATSKRRPRLRRAEA